MLTLDRATNARTPEGLAVRRAYTAEQREAFATARAARRAAAHDPTRRRLDPDGDDARLAREGRTDANGYAWGRTVAMVNGTATSVRYVPPLRIGAPIQTATPEGIALRNEYRRRRRTAERAKAGRRDALRQAAVLEDTLDRVLSRAAARKGRIEHQRFPHVYRDLRARRPEDRRWHYRRPAVIVMVRDLLTELGAARTFAAVAATVADTERHGARAMLLPIVRKRNAEAQQRRRNAMTDDERAAANQRRKDAYAAKLAAMTPDERAAFLAARAAKARAARAARKGK